MSDYLIIYLILGIIILLLAVLLIKQNKMSKKYNTFMNELSEDINVEETLLNLITENEIITEKSIKLEERIRILENKIKKSITIKNIKRYQAFKNEGGNQSFSIGLLDEEKNGLIMTSIFVQNGCSVYGKKIENGTSENRLSDEEIEVINS